MIYRGCLAVLVGVSGMAWASDPAPLPEGCPTPSTQYDLTADEGLLSVEIDHVLASPFLNIAGFVSREGMPTDQFITNLTIVHEGAQYTPESLGNGAWRVDGIEVGSRIAISYDLTLGHGAYTWSFGAEEVGVSAGDNHFLVSRVALLADYGAPGCPVNINVDAENFQSPWSKTGPNSYYAPDLDRFHNNGFAFGSEINRQVVSIREGAVTFVSDEDSKPFARQASQEIGVMMEHFVDMFGDYPADNYHVFIYANDRPEGAAFNDSFSFLYPTPLQDVDALIWRHGIVHELVHIWNGQTIRPAQGEDLEWFREGFTDYLAIKAMYRLGFLNEHEFAEKLENQMRRYVMGLYMSQGQVRLTQAGANKDENRFLIYGGGSTLAFMLDLEMSEKNGPGSFEAMFVELFKQSDEPYSHERLMAIMDEASGGAASRLLAQFDPGLMPTEFPALLDPYGVELAFMVPDMYQIDLTPGPETTRNSPPNFVKPIR